MGVGWLMSGSRKKLDEHVRELLGKGAASRRSLQIFIALATAAAGGLKVLTPSDATLTWASASVAMQVLLLALTFVAAVIVLLTDKSATSVVHDAQVAIDEAETLRSAAVETEAVIAQLELQMAKQTRVEYIVDAMRSVVDVALHEKTLNNDRLKEWMTDLLDFLVADKQMLFGIGDEQWNFSIYIFDVSTSELVCAVTRRPTTKEEQAPHRSWRAGEGHVGKAFQDRRPLVCADSTEANVRGFFDAPGDKLRDYDLDRYRSLAAIPIQTDEEQPLGVIVATSAVEGRFTPDDDETFRPILSLARTLATLVGVYNLRRHT